MIALSFAERYPEAHNRSAALGFLIMSRPHNRGEMLLVVRDGKLVAKLFVAQGAQGDAVATRVMRKIEMVREVQS